MPVSRVADRVADRVIKSCCEDGEDFELRLCKEQQQEHLLSLEDGRHCHSPPKYSDENSTDEIAPVGTGVSRSKRWSSLARKRFHFSNHVNVASHGNGSNKKDANDAVSVNSDKQSMEGIQSKASSLDTLPSSNRTPQRDSNRDKRELHKKGWNKFKRIVGGVMKTAQVDSTQSSNRLVKPKLSLGGLKGRRPSSEELADVRDDVSPEQTKVVVDKTAMKDDSIRGHLDGIDVLNLGGAQHASCASDVDDWPRYSFIGYESSISLMPPGDLVAQLVQEELVLDGYIPGVDDRWHVRLEESPDAETSSDRDCDTTCKAEEESMPTSQQVWYSLWGSEPPPSTTRNIFKRERQSGNASDNEDDNGGSVASLAAECPVPIDVDEDAFMISTREHYNAVLEIASIAITENRSYSVILDIFHKMLKGLKLASETVSSSASPKTNPFLIGTTLHNIGMVSMWQGDYDSALKMFSLAVDERVRRLPKNHPDIIVSMVRKALMQFALESLDDAVAVLEVALTMIQSGHYTKGKVRNNLGVVYFYQKEWTSAMREFTQSLETQRMWLETAGRRLTFVHGVSTTLCNMGRIYLVKDEAELACQVYQEALLLQTTVFRKDTDEVMQSLVNVALCRARAGQFKKALQLLHGCIRSKNARFGAGSPESMEILGWMGYLYMKRSDFTDAGKCLSTVQYWQKDVLPPEHPSAAQTRSMISSMEHAISKDMWI